MSAITTRDGIRRRMLLALPAAVVATALIGSPSFAATHTPAAGASLAASWSATTSQGIIMRDGGICDPIRHMGC